MSIGSIFSSASTAANQVIHCQFGYRGIGVGRLFLVDHRLPVINEKFVSDPSMVSEEELKLLCAAELEKLDLGYKSTCKHYDKMIEKAQKIGENGLALLVKMNKQNCAIFYAYAKKLVEEEYKTAGKAIWIVAKRQAAEFDKLGSVQFRVKADDCMDIGTTFIRHVLNLPQPDFENIPENSLVIADRISPAEFVSMKMALHMPDGIAVREGSQSGHVGDLSRGMKLPSAFIPSDAAFERLAHLCAQGQNAIFDGIKGKIILDPSPDQIRLYSELEEKLKARASELAHLKNVQTATKDGAEINLSGTIAGESDLRDLSGYNIQLVSLFRTEFIAHRGHIPSYEEQVRIYRDVLDNAAMQKITVTFRTFDFEGDKNQGLEFSTEEKARILDEQIKAIITAAGLSKADIRIMIPNVRLISEARTLRSKCESTYAQLKESGVPVPEELPKFGVMVETPSLAVHVEKLKGIVDFLSLGTNDLPASFVYAQRNKADHELFLDFMHPEILHFVYDLIQKCVQSEIPTYACGSQAMNENLMGFFIGAGLNNFSVGPPNILEMRYTARQINLSAAAAHAQKIRSLEDIEAIKAEIKSFNRQYGIGIENRACSELKTHDENTPISTP